MDAETQRYVDKSMDTVKAQNDARFAEVLHKLDHVSETLREKPGLPWLIGVGVTGVLAVMGLLSFGGTYFDSGMTAATFKIQSDKNAMQIKALVDHSVQTDAKLDKLIGAVTSLQPKH